MNKAYNKITWQNKPSTATPLNQTNLNEMSNALDTIDDRVIALDSGKVSSVTVTNTLPTGDTIATITVDGTATNIKSAQVEVDSTPSATSENPLQNKAIYEMLNNLLPEETAEGNPIAISDASGLNAKSCSVDLLPIQDLSHGEPSPTNICPISGRTEVSVTRTGKNLIDINAYDDEHGYYNVNGQFSASSSYNLYTVKVVPETTYTISGNFAGIITYWDKDLAFLSGVNQGSGFSRTFTTPENCEYIRKSILISNIDGTQMLELGSPATTYEPYQGLTVTVQFGQTVYGGKLDVTNGKLTIDRAIVDLGTLTWAQGNVGTENAYFYSSALSDFKYISETAINYICSNYKSISVSQRYQNGTVFINNAKQVAIKDNNYTDAPTFKTAMSGVQLCYELATPIELTLTPEEISLLKGNNTLTTDGDNINLVYSADIGLYIAGQLNT